ncbi:MAG TPA: thiol reductant ABC exporter subunit CydC [Acidocella sp.]|uniref:thiol reductant ABC exporter subunit CydC n=1 Tax=Acidocella sp. TaxID=50710 RepID=UPI002BBFC48C|nr:thiol reductant ABC exporter subunit CydC [Acidocella sp.]HVE21038.1 thiol reductant ABC exporter subunit CydC [Acidocella sp.]
MKDLLRLLWLFKGSWRWVFAGIGLTVVVILANVGLLALSGWFIAAMALAGLGTRDIDYFTPAAAIRGLAVLRTGGRYLERLTTHEATLRFLARLRVWFYTHLEPLAPARLQYYRGGDLLSRIRADIDSLDNVYLRVLVPTASAFITVGLMVLFLLWFSPHVALADLAGLALAGVAVPLVALRLARKPGARAVALRGTLRADIADTIRGFGELLIYRGLDARLAGLASGSAALIATQRREARIGAASTATSLLIAQLSLWVAVIVALPLVGQGLITGPDFAMIGLFVLASFDAVSALPAAYNALGQSLAAARRIFEVIDTSPAITEPGIEASPPTRFDLRVEGLKMRYADTQGWALDDVSFTIPQGGCLGVIGQTGAGKTSLLNVLLRFWDFQEGSVEIGGVSLRALSGETIRSLCAVVAQQTHLFNTSIRENLFLARPDATEEELCAALRDADILDEVMAMPGGLDTMVGEAGTGLSGGQARRIAMARAFLKNAPLLILDEPTEGLDAVSERAVLDTIARLARGRTTLLITHRPQALRLADGVLVLEQGRARLK